MADQDGTPRIGVVGAGALGFHHVRILRTADLATSRRNGKLVMYRLTETGARMLTAVVGAAQPLDADPTTAEALS